MPQDGGENGNGRVTHYYVAQSGQEQSHGGYGTAGESMRVGGRGERSAQVQAQAGGSKDAGTVPPSYEQAVGADNKVQT